MKALSKVNKKGLSKKEELSNKFYFTRESRMDVKEERGQKNTSFVKIAKR